MNNHRLLEQSLRILTLVSLSGSMTFRDICESVDLPKSTTHNLVQTMVNMNFLSRGEDSGKYTVGLKSFEVGNAYLSSNPFFTMAKEVVEAVAGKCNETAHFAILNGTDVVYLYKIENTQPLQIYSHIGKRLPAHSTALGKALLSGYDEERIWELYPGERLPALTENTITHVDELLRQLREVRSKGVAFETEESSPYIKCVAVPVLNKQGHPVAGLSIATSVNLDEQKTKNLVPLLYEAKLQLEGMLKSLD